MSKNSRWIDPRAPTGLRAVVLQASAVLIASAFMLGIAEATLRLFPQLIGLAALSEFDEGLRSEIAKRLNLPTMRESLRITTAERFDHGREIHRAAANSRTKRLADANDIALGAVEDVNVDANGFCNDKIQYKSGATEVLLVGDSFTFCTGVRATETAAYQFQEMTGRVTYNLGIPGIGPREYLELARRFAPIFHPKIVVLNIYEGNDLRDLVREQKFLLRGIDSSNKIASPWHVSYALEFLIANVKLSIKAVKGLTAEHDFHYKAPINGKMMEMNTSNRDQDEVDTAIDLSSGKVSLELFLDPLKNFVSWAQATGIKPVVLYTPSMYTAYDKTVIFSDPKVGSVLRAQSEAQRAWLAAHAADIGFTYYDLTSDFQTATAAGELTHFPGNVHLTSHGHAVVARALAAILQ